MNIDFFTPDEFKLIINAMWILTTLTVAMMVCHTWQGRR